MNLSDQLDQILEELAVIGSSEVGTERVDIDNAKAQIMTLLETAVRGCVPKIVLPSESDESDGYNYAIRDVNANLNRLFAGKE